MLTFQQKWQSLHHPSTDVSGDADFYCRLYEKLCRLTRQEARQSDAAILSLLLYTENIIATGLDGVYEYMYRSLGTTSCPKPWRKPPGAPSGGG